ncbi:MAG: metalloregulator ArsR/SmtB family transcription factor [Pseudomonadota bacterium]
MDKKSAVNLLSALSNETRLDVFRLLVQAGPSGLPAGEISEELGVLQNTMSSHLNILSQSGLLTRTREGRIIRYSVDYEEMRSLVQYLLEDCCAGEKSICQPFLPIKARSC